MLIFWFHAEFFYFHPSRGSFVIVQQNFRDFHFRMLRMTWNLQKSGLEKFFGVCMYSKGRKHESLVDLKEIELSDWNSFISMDLVENVFVLNVFILFYSFN